MMSVYVRMKCVAHVCCSSVRLSLFPTGWKFCGAQPVVSILLSYSLVQSKSHFVPADFHRPVQKR